MLVSTSKFFKDKKIAQACWASMIVVFENFTSAY